MIEYGQIWRSKGPGSHHWVAMPMVKRWGGMWTCLVIFLDAASGVDMVLDFSLAVPSNWERVE